jgi:hypothetical protein
MLLAQALTEVETLRKEGLLIIDNDESSDVKVSTVLLQLLRLTICSQLEGGSWNHSTEITSYAVLTLAALAKSHCPPYLKQQIGSILKAAQKYIQTKVDNYATFEYLWIEKVSYGSRTLTQSFAIAALQHSGEPLLESKFLKPIILPAVLEPFSRLPILMDMPPWLLELCMHENENFVPLLKQACQRLVPGDSANGSHLGFVPFTWMRQVLWSILSSVQRLSLT